MAELGAAEVLERGWRVAGTNHLHAAFGCCGTHHGVEVLVLQLAGSDTCSRQRPSDVLETFTDALTMQYQRSEYIKNYPGMTNVCFNNS